jgi:hypothetical protein
MPTPFCRHLHLWAQRQGHRPRPSLPSYHLMSLNASQRIISELGGLRAKLYTRMEEVLGSSLGRDTGYLDCSFSWFSQSLQANAGTVPRLDHNCFPPNPFQFIFYLSSCHPTLHNIDTEDAVKQPTREINGI